MKNYIVRNCPAMEAYCTCGKYYDYNKQISTRCKDITDCVTKRIVELCDSNVSKVLYEGETLKFVEGNPLAKKILELLEIEECE